MKRFNNFIIGLQQDLKAFAFLIILLMVFRILFLLVFKSQLAGVATVDIVATLWYGFRLSLKTAGLMVFIGAVFSTIVQLLLPCWPAAKIRRYWHSLVVCVFTILFFARIPYYKIFNSGFNMMLINGIHDDWQAILATGVEEYQLLLRLPLAFAVAAVLIYFLLRLLRTKNWSAVKQTGTAVSLPEKTFAVTTKKMYCACAALVVFLPLFFVFIRFGASFNYAGSISWENAARLNSNLLNEAVLDDGQALYRVYISNRCLRETAGTNLTQAEIVKQISILGGDPQAATIEQAFSKKVVQAKMQQKPQQIVMIMGESYGVWPLLPEFVQLGLAAESEKLLQSPHSASVNTFLAHGTGTMPAINGYLTGLADAYLYENYQPESYKTGYATGLGKMMKDLGYKTVFWYGGFKDWQNLGDFVLAQNFDEFRCADEIKYAEGDAWGCPDEALFEHIEQYIGEHREEKIFHFIMTTSNHPPYTIDVAAKGFDKERVKNMLPDSIAGDDETLNELGHFWYSDHVMGLFVQKVEQKIPSALFIITGDHSERFSFKRAEDLRTLSVVPMIFYGQGVEKDWFQANKVGCPIQLIPTLMEMLGQPGQEYASILPSLFDEHFNKAFNHRLWACDGTLGEMDQIDKQELPADQSKVLQKAQDIKKMALAAKKVTAWRVLKGNAIKIRQ